MQAEENTGMTQKAARDARFHPKADRAITITPSTRSYDPPLPFGLMNSPTRFEGRFCAGPTR